MSSSLNPLVRKLSHFIDLTTTEQGELEAWCAHSTAMPARKRIIAEGDRPERTCLVLNGVAGRYKVLQDGRRQILGLLLPGDMCDLHGFLLASADHSIETLSAGAVALIPSADILRSLEREPRLTRALWWSTLVDLGIAREWAVNIGQRNASTRIAHFFCEVWARAEVVGLIREVAFRLPMTQEELGAATALSSVHVNRSLRSLREQKLVRYTREQLIVPDFDRLAAFAGFDPRYLQLQRRA